MAKRDITGDAQWTAFVRGWRDTMRSLFLPTCSRSPCCERECRNLAEHHAATGDTVFRRMS